MGLQKLQYCVGMTSETIEKITFRTPKLKHVEYMHLNPTTYGIKSYTKLVSYELLTRDILKDVGMTIRKGKYLRFNYVLMIEMLSKHEK